MFVVGHKHKPGTPAGKQRQGPRKPETQKRLEEDGWVVGDAQSFLGLSDAEMAYIDLALDLADVLRARRMEMGLTQQEAAARIGSTPAGVARMEAGHPSVSVERLIRALFALGVTAREMASMLLEDVRENAA